MTDSFLVFSYQFNFTDKESLELKLDVDPLTMELKINDKEPPLWAALDFNQCPNCPLSSETNAFCPVAKNLVPLLHISNTLVSYDEVNVIITTANRTFSADTTMQRAVSSILGLIMATSPCPFTEFLKPMARFHLPLATEEETLYRTTSMYMLAQHFKSQQDIDYEIGFKGLIDIYANLKIINRALANRIRAAIEQDATVNAIILLDLLSQAVTWSIEDKLEELQPLFSTYLKDKKVE